jgi:hypothetical protein
MSITDKQHAFMQNDQIVLERYPGGIHIMDQSLSLSAPLSQYSPGYYTSPGIFCSPPADHYYTFSHSPNINSLTPAQQASYSNVVLVNTPVSSNSQEYDSFHSHSGDDKRSLHVMREKGRRMVIKNKFDQLKDLIGLEKCWHSLSRKKLTKVSILKVAVEYISKLKKDKELLLVELSKLQNKR